MTWGQFFLLFLLTFLLAGAISFWLWSILGELRRQTRIQRLTLRKVDELALLTWMKNIGGTPPDYELMNLPRDLIQNENLKMEDPK